MRVIPKKTKVGMELFRGIGVLDVLVGSVGLSLSASFLTANLPGHMVIATVMLIATVGLLFPIEDDKGYMTLYYILKYGVRIKKFKKRGSEGAKASVSVEDITPFTGIDGEFIEYGNVYSAVVMNIPSVEFRFYTESRQNGLIDRVLGSILRTAMEEETISMVKVDRPVIYDDFITAERRKLEELKESYLNGILSEEELTVRVGIVYDRIAQLEELDYKEKVYIPFHYLVFIYKDREYLKNQIRDAMSLFASNGMVCHQLKGAELAIFLKYNYGLEFDEREAYRLKPEQYRDWILPDEISFAGRTVKFDRLITHNFRLRDYPATVGNAWGCQFFNSMGTKVVLKMKPIDRYKAVRQIDRSIDELREQQNNTGKASKLLEVSTHIDTLSEVLRLLQGENETLFNVSTYVTVCDYELSNEMERNTQQKKRKGGSPRKKQVRRELSEEGFKVTDMFLQQFEAYTSSQISGYDAFKRYQRGIQSNSVAAAFPYVYKFLCDDNGIYVGESGGVPVFINFFKRDLERVNSNAVIIGKSGSGKSYATKAILAQLAAEDSKIFILDPENEYSKLAAALDGKIIDVGNATQGRLNPFHIITTLSDDEENDGEGGISSFNAYLQFLEEFYRQILPGLDPDALEQLNNITIRMYESKGITEETDLSTLKPADFPTFDDLYDKILNDFQLTTGEYSKNNLRILLNYVSKFATGGRNSSLWNGEASISTNENFIVFNFQSLLANKNNTIANAQMLLVLKWLDNEIIKNRDYNIKYHADRKIVVVIDEAHVFIDSKYPIALDFMYQLAKRIRKYNGMQMVITQNIKDFVGTEELARKSTAIINASQYSFIFPLAPNDMQDLCTLYEKAGAINESEQEDIVNNGRGRAFLITSPTERTCVDIVAGRGIEELFTM